MAKALKIASVVLAVGALAIVTGGAAVGLGLSLSTTFLGVSASALFLASAGLSAAGSLLAARPKAPQASSATADRLTVSIDARTPRKFAFGRTALATDLRDQEYSGDQTFVHRFIVVAAHRVTSFEEIWFDDYLAWSAGTGVTGKAAGYLQVDVVEEGSPDNAIVISGRMGSTRRYTGCAYVHLCYRLKGLSKNVDSPFAQSIPTRVTIVGRGAALYDPRLDSTAGGQGLHRADDQTTWTWSDTSSRNPALALLWYLLGYRIRNPVTGEWKLSVGQSIPPSRIDLESFITAANLCDEPVQKADGTYEPRYRCDGLFSEGDAPKVVLDSLKATMNAVLDDNDGRLRLTVLHNDLATPAAPLTTDDVLGEFRWDQTPPLSDTFNVVRGSYTDPSPLSLYQQIDAPEVRIPSPDGIERVETVNLPTVQSASQKQRLDKQRVRRMLYSGTFSATFQATAWRYQKGDVVPFTFAPLGWVNKLFRVVDMTVQVDGRVPMVLRVEHPSIYADDGTETAPIDGVEPTRYDQDQDPIRRRLALLANAVERGLFDPLAIYVGGNVVALEDGSRWLCVAATAAVGNRPSGANGDWSLLQGSVGVIPSDTVLGGTLDPVTGIITGGAPAASLAPALISLDKAIADIDAANAEATALADTTRKTMTEALAAQLLGEVRKDRLLALTHLDGVPIGPVVKRVDQARQDGDTALAESITIVRAAVEGEIETRAADIVRIDRAIVDQASAQAQSLATVRAELQGGIDGERTGRVADVTRLDQARVDQGTIQAQALASVKAELQGGIDGERTGRVADVTRLDQARVDQDASTAQAIASVSGAIGHVDGRVSSLSQVVLDLDTSTAQAITSVSGAIGHVYGRVTDLRQVVVGPDGAIARAVIEVDAEGVIGGAYLTSDGRKVDIAFQGDTFTFFDRSTGVRKAPFSIVGGKVRATDFEADTVTYGALVQRFTERQQLDPYAWWQELPGGLIAQGGRFRSTIQREVALSIVFPRTFPSQVLSVQLTPQLAAYSSARDLWLQLLGEPDVSGFTCQTQAATSNNMTLDGFDWLAWGR